VVDRNRDNSADSAAAHESYVLVHPRAMRTNNLREATQSHRRPFRTTRLECGLALRVANENAALVRFALPACEISLPMTTTPAARANAAVRSAAQMLALNAEHLRNRPRNDAV